MSISFAHLKALVDIARSAGREIMAVYATDFASWQKDDASPLTEADLRADRVIREGLEAAFPGVFILSEESSSAIQGGESIDRFFLVDPLDGTKEFLKRNDEFTVNIALIENGEPVAGVVYAPALDEMFYGAKGAGAWKVTGQGQGAGAGERELHTSLSAPGADLRIIGSRTHGGEALAAWLAQLTQPHTFVAAGSSLKFCRLAEGAADVYPRLGPTCQWDTAAGQAVLEAAGGVVLRPDGQPLRYGVHRETLNPNFLALARAGLNVPAVRQMDPGSSPG